MKNRIHIFSLLIVAVLFSAASTFAQSAESENARTALKTGSSRELMNMLDNQFELTLFDKKYSRKNCEPVLRDFFNANPSQSFKYVHKGASKDGSLSYSIGHYQTSSEKFRVVIRFRKSGEDYKIHKLEVSEL
jgi:hypothetical protein